MGTMTFLLNCFVLGDDEERVFSIEIAKDKNVGILNFQEIDQGGKGPSPQSRRCLRSRALESLPAYR